jgi:hypothetical protein
VVSFGEKHRLGVIVDTLQERSTSIVVDANGNGDLTDDKRRTGREHVVELRLNGAYPYAVSICVAWMGSADREGPSIRWGRACLMHGLLKVAGTAYAIALEDATDDGTYDFHQHDYGEDVYSGDRLLVDTNANGRIDGMIEARDVRHPFFIKGRAFQVTHIQPNGEFLRVREQETRTVLLSAHDSRNAEPLTGVTMTVYPGWHVVTTDHDGSVRLQVPQGDYHVIAQRDRHIPEYQRLVVGSQDGGTEQLCEFSLVEWQRLKGTVSLRPGEAYKFFSGKTVHCDEPMSHDPAKSIEIARESDLAYRIHRGDHYVDAIGQRRLIHLGETAQRMTPGPILDGQRSCPVSERHSYALCLSEYTRPDVFESTYSISHYIVFDVLEATDERLRIRWEFAHRPSADAELTWPARIDQGVPDVGEAKQ